jgi:signal transduction histidine kinase
VTVAAVLASSTVALTVIVAGHVQLVAGPLSVTRIDQASLLDECAKVALLGTVGAIATYATAWGERTLRRALAAQVRRDTEERAMVERLRETETLAAIGTLAAATVHDVRNPLTSIGLQSEMMLRMPLGEGLHEELRLIRDEARRAQSFLSDLLTFARSASKDDDARPLSIGERIDEAVAAVRPLLNAHRVPVEITVEDVANAETLPGSAVRLERALVNLLVNAIHAMEGQTAPKLIRIRVRAGLVIDVEDTGPGFPEDLATRAFERFVTTKPTGKGTGLGLWIVRQTVSSLGGTVTATNLTDGGARIRLDLPAYGEASGERSAPANIHTAPTAARL